MLCSNILTGARFWFEHRQGGRLRSPKLLHQATSSTLFAEVGWMGAMDFKLVLKTHRTHDRGDRMVSSPSSIRSRELERPTPH